jgi:diguanylate cyclase (GGDEF)-like protein/PAS domain S-box-containing protein
MTMVVIVSVTAVFGFHAVQMFQHERVRIMEELQSESAETLKRLAGTVGPFIESYQPNEYYKLVNQEIATEGYDAILLHDYKLGELTGQALVVSGVVRTPEGALTEFNDTDSVHQDILRQAVYWESRPIVASSGDELIGELFLYVAGDDLALARAQAIKRILIEVTFGVVILTTLLVMAARRLILNPLHRLSAVLGKHDTGGPPAGFLPRMDYRELAVLTDSLERSFAQIKEGQKRLLAETERLDNVIDGTDTGVWEWNVASGEVKISDRWARMIGYELGELEPVSIDTCMELINEADIDSILNSLQQHFSGQAARYDADFRMRHKQGHWVWIRARGRVVSRQGDGKPLLIHGTQQDVTERKLETISLEESERRFRSFFEDNLSPMMLLEPNTGKIRDVNLAARQFYGANKEELKHRGLSGLVVRDKQGRYHRPHLDENNQEGSVVFRHRVANGEVRDVEIHATPLDFGSERLLYAIVHDVTERVRAEQHIKLSASVFTHSMEGIAIANSAGLMIDVNEAFLNLMGCPKEAVLGRGMSLLWYAGENDPGYEAARQAISTVGHWSGEIQWERGDGEEVTALAQASTVKDVSGEIASYFVLLSDITQLKKSQQELLRMAHYDVLTGLPNRLLLADRLRQAMHVSDRTGSPLAVLFLDLDGFKAINDEHGHSIGDELLIAVSERMAEAVRASDTLARIGGDEFVAVLTDLEDESQCLPVIDRIVKDVSEPVRIREQALSVSVSIGVSVYPQAGDIDADQLLRQADQAMYRVKVTGKHGYAFHDAGVSQGAEGRHELLDEIERGMAHDEFVLFYQPKVNMKDGALIGLEALLRWQHPERGLLTPDRFLPVLEEHSMMTVLGDWVIRCALKALSALQEQGIAIDMNVNVAAIQLEREDFVEKLRDMLSEHPDIQPSQLVLEIVETSALENMNYVGRVMEACSAFGVRFALDDFGTGYSSLTYLKRLPADILKIDRSFVRNMIRDSEDLAILQGVIGMAHAFRRTVIAEGVETEEHGQLLLWLGCEQAQGYAIARPMPVEQVKEWRATWQVPGRWLVAEPVSHAMAPLLFSIVHHRAWVMALDNYCRGASSRTPAMDVDACGFLPMIRRVGSLRPESLQVVEALHEEVHSAARQLLKAQGASEQENLDALEARFNGVSENLLAILEGLLIEPGGVLDIDTTASQRQAVTSV